METLEYLRCEDLLLEVELGDLTILVRYAVCKPGSPQDYYVYHCHSSYELHFIFEGKGVVRVHETSFTLTPGTVYLTGPGIYHEQIPDPQEPAGELCINFEIQVKKDRKSESPAMRGEVDRITDTLLTHNFWFGKDTRQSAALLWMALQELQKREIGYVFSVKSLLTQVVINLVRDLDLQQTSSYSLPVQVLDNKRRRILDDFFSYEYRCTAPPETLANRLGVSVRQLNRILIQAYGMGYTQKLTFARLVFAKDLLAFSPLTVAQIAERIGFSHVSYFNKVFKTHEYITPTEYRRRVKESDDQGSTCGR